SARSQDGRRASPSANPVGTAGKGTPTVNTHTRGRGLRLRRRSVAALLTITTAVVPATIPPSTEAQGAAGATPAVAPAKLHAAARRSVLVGQKVPVSGALSTGQSGKGILVQTQVRGGWKTV